MASYKLPAGCSALTSRRLAPYGFATRCPVLSSRTVLPGDGGGGSERRYVRTRLLRAVRY
eukprot:1033876-Rhodomonas_salina.1